MMNELMKYKHIRMVFLFLLLAVFNTKAGRSQSVETYSLNSDNSMLVWKVLPADLLNNSGQIMTPDFDDKKWVKATVPGTVFGSYVEQGLEKDPNFGDNIYQVDKEKYDKNFWYRTEFTVPESIDKDIVWLNFEGINRRGTVYVNGTCVGRLNGFYERGKYDITKILNRSGKNVLAVLVECPTPPIPNFESPTYISSASWDWMPYVPGLLSGITDDVFLTTTNGFEMIDPWIRTMEIRDNEADLQISLDVANYTRKRSGARLVGKIMPGNISFSKELKLGGRDRDYVNDFDHITLTKKEIAALLIKEPNLWWPNGYGDPKLYTCKLQLEVDDKVSDEKTITFGIRKYSYDKNDNVLHISINGKRIFLKGGNWGMSEYMLRCRGAEYDTKVRLHQEMNYNIIRNWIGSTTDEEFYKACDKYGIMVWDDFWLNSHPNLPDDVQAFNKNAIEKIKRLRNYACISVWCGDNEGYPRPPLNEWLQEDVNVFDGGDRRYHANSHSDALTGSGIWVNLEPQGYFASPPLGFGGEKGWGLRTEIGTAVITNFESFKKFIPEKDWWPRNDMWNKHFFGDLAANAGPDAYFETIEKSYGKASGIEDFCRKSQLLNIETNKAMYEGWVDHIWDDASGIMIWMSQSAYPSFVWQTYDYYYDLNGAYWGAKSACEPVHILWNCANNKVRVTNTSSDELKEVTATAKVYNLDGKEVPSFSKSATIDVPSNAAQTGFTIQFDDEENLAFQKSTFASSTADEAGDASQATDGGVGSRWGSNYSDDQWIYVDLGKILPINEIQLYWENAYASSYKLQVSDDAQNWKDVYINSESKGGREKIEIDPVSTRYVRMLGVKRATQWGYSLWEMKVLNVDRSVTKINPLSPVHFIRLQLRDKEGNLLSDNFYWRGNEYLNYKALNTLQKVKLQVKTETEIVANKRLITAEVSSPESAPNVAFALRVMLVDEKTGEQILPAFMDANYFSLMPGETRTIHIEVDEKLANEKDSKVIVQQYNPN
ncbi:discoidin domain-containing protein [Sunxiuqinia sp. A32]|uniref:discoidin domain-containing protein n=1 Tax=Sunxiuqinia sp. A32 TaxID=3461496 RepID=UPI00404618E1